MSGFLTLNNRGRLFLDESGQSADRVLVCLHGLGGGGYFFSGLAPSLNGWRVLSPDMPGSGFSPRGDQAISFDRFADVVVELIERKTIGSVALLGHSMGAITALKAKPRKSLRLPIEKSWR